MFHYKNKNGYIFITLLIVVFLLIPISYAESNKFVSTTPEVVYGPFIIVDIDADFPSNEGFVERHHGVGLLLYFEPDDVTNQDNYIKITPFYSKISRDEKDILNLPFNDGNWPVQWCRVQVILFTGSFDDSNGRIKVNGKGLFTTVFHTWHKWPEE